MADYKILVDQVGDTTATQVSDATPMPVGVVAVASGGYSYANIATNATTVVKAGAGTLHSITINTKGASSNTATIYDNTAGSGTKIATIDTTAAQTTLVLDVAFATGLTIVTATGTAGDLTVAYK